MPKWDSRNHQGSLEIHSESISGKFCKETGYCTIEGDNILIIHKDHSNGVERTIVAEKGIMCEDSRYVYFRTMGKIVESIQQISRRRKRHERKKKIQVG